jgi:acetyltransferase
MSVRNLDKMFQRRSVALIGATARAGSIGAVTMRNLCRAGFCWRAGAGQPAALRD